MKKWKLLLYLINVSENKKSYIMFKIGDKVVCIKPLSKNHTGDKKYTKFGVYVIYHEEFYPSYKLGGPKDKETSHYSYSLYHIGKYSRRKGRIIKSFFKRYEKRPPSTFPHTLDYDLENNFMHIEILEREEKIKQILK